MIEFMGFKDYYKETIHYLNHSSHQFLSIQEEIENLSQEFLKKFKLLISPLNQAEYLGDFLYDMIMPYEKDFMKDNEVKVPYILNNKMIFVFGKIGDYFVRKLNIT